jgi:hypothetical protein
MILLSILAAPAGADDEPAPAPVNPSSALAALAATKPLSAEELGEQRAKADIEIDSITINDSDQDGAVAGNAAIGNRTGANTIASDAFATANGVITAVQNTGNNVLIQNATIINVSVEQ